MTLFNKIHTLFFWIAAAGLLLNASCRSSKTDPAAFELPEIEVNADEEEDEEIIAEEADSKPYNASADRHFNLLSTELEVQFSLSRREMDGKAVLKLTPYFYPQTELVIDAKYFIINKIALYRIKSGKPQLEKVNPDFLYDSLKIFITLPSLWQKGDTLQINFDYVARPEMVSANREEGSPISDRKGLYFINPDGSEAGKPTQIWTQGEPTASSCWFPTIDEPNQRHSQKISMTVPQRWVTLSNGILKGSKKLGDSLRTDVWEQTLPHAPYLTMMATGEFAIVKDSWRGKDVWYFVEPEYERYARMVFGKTPKMIELYSKLLGVDYPWDKYHQIVVRDFVSGAMENTGAVVHYDALQHDARRHLDETNEDIIAHELFHHWFGDLVTCESWGQLPLNESFATYGEYLWLEHEYARFDADYHHRLDANKYRDENSYKSEKMIRTDYETPMEMFDNHSYAKGGLILHMLRKTIGDEAFFQGLNKYLTDNKFQSVELANLRLALEEVSGLDLSRFFQQWFYREGHPKITAEHYWDGEKRSYTIITRQEFEHGKMPYWIPLEVDFYQAGERKSRKRIVLSKFTDTFSFYLPTGAPDAVSFDAEKSILADITEVKPIAMWRNQLKNGPLLMDYITAMEHLSEEEPDMLRSEMPALLRHPSWTVRESAVLALTKISVEVRNPEADAIIKTLMIGDSKASVRLASLSYFEGSKDDGLDPLITQACYDSSYRVAGNALIMLTERDPEKAREILNSNLHITDMEYRMALAVSIAVLGKGDYVDFLGKMLDDAPEYAKFEVLGVIAQYGEGTTGETRKKLIAMLEEKQTRNNEGLIGFYFFAIIRQLKK